MPCWRALLGGLVRTACRCRVRRQGRLTTGMGHTRSTTCSCAEALPVVRPRRERHPWRTIVRCASRSPHGCTVGVPGASCLGLPPAFARQHRVVIVRRHPVGGVICPRRRPRSDESGCRFEVAATTELLWAKALLHCAAKLGDLALFGGPDQDPPHLGGVVLADRRSSVPMASTSVSPAQRGRLEPG